jgi:hypothetical protein
MHFIKNLNVCATTENKCGDIKDSFYEELEELFSHFLQYHMKILLGDFIAKLAREDICQSTTGNETLHQDSNGNDVKVIKYNAQPIKVMFV